MSIRKSAQKTFKWDPQLWDHPEKWPHVRGYVFLAQAFNEIGCALYEERWVGSPDDLEPEEPDDDCDDERWEEYERACERAELDFQKMRSDVTRRIAAECEAATLVSAARAQSGGKMIPLEPYYWNTEKFWTRFSRCEMSLKHPFSDDAGIDRQQYCIFITRDSLDNYLVKPDAVLDFAIRPGDAADLPRSIESIIPKPFEQPRAHRRHLTEKALIELYGSKGPGLGVTEERCHQDVDAWVRKNGEPKGVSKSTLRRARRALRSTGDNIALS